MTLQVSSRIAIFALIELASESERQMSVAEIGAKYNASAHHLAKVMHTLGKAGLVRSTRGLGGGYVFIGNARRITLLDIIQLFEEPASSGQQNKAAHFDIPAEQALENVLFEIDDIAKATFGAITIATMLKQIRR